MPNSSKETTFKNFKSVQIWMALCTCKRETKKNTAVSISGTFSLLKQQLSAKLLVKTSNEVLAVVCFILIYLFYVPRFRNPNTRQPLHKEDLDRGTMLS